MKALITLIIFGITLSSCSSYKTIDLTKHKIEISKTYKITNSNGYVTKTKRCLIINDSLTCKKLKLPILNIKQIKQRKFSYLKTGALVVGVLGFEVLVISESTNNINIGTIENSN